MISCSMKGLESKEEMITKIPTIIWGIRFLGDFKIFS